jgi:cell division topological specificity factor
VEGGVTLFGFFRRSPPASSAQTAKKRLQILLHERQDRSGPDYLPPLQKDILEVIKKYVPLANGKVAVKLERGVDMSALAIDIELPAPKAQHPKPAMPRPRAALAR